MSTLAQRRTARKAYQQAATRTKPGEGSRFAAVERSAKLGGARNPAAVAATTGRKKYSKSRFQAMAARGRSEAAAKKGLVRRTRG